MSQLAASVIRPQIKTLDERIEKYNRPLLQTRKRNPELELAST